MQQLYTVIAVPEELLGEEHTAHKEGRLLLPQQLANQEKSKLGTVGW